MFTINNSYISRPFYKKYLYNKIKSKTYNFESLLCKIQTGRQIILNPSSPYSTRIQVIDDIYSKAVETINSYEMIIDELQKNNDTLEDEIEEKC